MRSAQHLAVRVALLGTVLLGAGCFRPKIISGGFTCGSDGGCPENFYCNPGTNTCYQNGSGGSTGTGGKGGAGGQGGQAGGPTDAGVDRPCLPAVADPNCPSDAGAAGLCDPVCNSRCNCYEKCSVNTNGALTCNQLHPSNQAAVGLLAFCSPYSPADPTQQSDNCGPGQICVNASTCPEPRCYQFCRDSNDCLNGASCTRDAGAYQFCDVPPQVCNPLGSARNNSGCAAGFSCYLAPAGGTTLCDCQYDRSSFGPNPGSGGPGDQCNHSRDCLSGNVCVQASAFFKTCEPVCLLPVDGGTDSCLSGCRPLSSGTTYGWCNG
jgi:hypothetical protein